MVLGGSEESSVVLSGPEWNCVVLNSPEWSCVVLSGSEWSLGLLSFLDGPKQSLAGPQQSKEVLSVLSSPDWPLVVVFEVLQI